MSGQPLQAPPAGPIGPDRAPTPLTPWYAYYFLHEFVPIYPLYGILFVEQGLTPFQLSVLFTSWAVAGLVAEVPSGALADTVSRRSLLTAASVAKAAAYAVWLVHPAFWGFWAGFILWGISGALRSGTAEALLHDTLLEQGREGDFTRVYGRIRAVATVSIGAAMLGGSRLVHLGYEPVLLVSTGTVLAAAVVAALFLRETERHTPEKVRYVARLRSGCREALSNRYALFIVLLSLTVLPVGGAFDEFVGPILKENGFTRSTAATLFAVIYLVQIGGMLTAHRIHRYPIGRSLLLFVAAAGLLACATVGQGWSAPVGIAGFFGLFALASTLFAGKLQECIQGASRATVTSVAGLAANVGGILTFLLFGLVASERSLDPGIIAVSAGCALAALLFRLLAHRWRLR